VRGYVLVGDSSPAVGPRVAQLADEVLFQFLVGGPVEPEPVEGAVFFADVAVERDGELAKSGLLALPGQGLFPYHPLRLHANIHPKAEEV
jgi:hypothetical protein